MSNASCGSNKTILCRGDICEDEQKITARNVSQLIVTYYNSTKRENISVELRDLIFNTNLCVYGMFFILTDTPGVYRLYRRDVNEKWNATDMMLHIKFVKPRFRSMYVQVGIGVENSIQWWGGESFNKKRGKELRKLKDIVILFKEKQIQWKSVLAQVMPKLRFY